MIQQVHRLFRHRLRQQRLLLLKQLYQTLFIGRPGTGHYFQVHHPIQSLLIREICNAVPVIRLRLRIFRFPKSDLPSYFRSGTRSITCHYLNIDACRLTFATAAGTSGRIGSEMATTPKKFRSFSATNATQSSGA